MGTFELGISPSEFTVLESETAAAISAFMADHEGRPDELLHCHDVHGSRLIGISRGIREAELSEAMKEFMADAGGRVWHNHPSGDSLSGPDWLAAGCDHVEVMALTMRGSIFAGRITDWSDVMWELAKRHGRIAGFADGVLRHGTGQDGAELKQNVAGLIGHLINLELARRGLVAYGFKLSPMDEDALVAARAQGLVTAVEREIGSAIDEVLFEAE